jgi:hypothetical protein
MTTNTTLQFAGVLLLSCVAATPLASFAGSSTKCDQIAKDVRESVTKDPSKVLMIVEDALVINESCACEIIKSAIQASHADTALAKQIVQTAVAVAPKMTSIIVECAEAAAPGAGGGTSLASGGKGVASVGADVADPKDGGSSYSGGRGDVRGVYLMQPAGGGFFSPPSEEDDNADTPTPRKPRVIYVDKPRRHVTPPVSPSCTCTH